MTTAYICSVSKAGKGVHLFSCRGKSYISFDDGYISFDDISWEGWEGRTLALTTAYIYFLVGGSPLLLRFQGWGLCDAHFAQYLFPAWLLTGRSFVELRLSGGRCVHQLATIIWSDIASNSLSSGMRGQLITSPASGSSFAKIAESERKYVGEEEGNMSFGRPLVLLSSL